jgi:fermentation-respiration switch protein FrsA (DUF1100 family)
MMIARPSWTHRLMPLAIVAVTLAMPPTAAGQATASVVLRGRPQTVRLYGSRGATPVIVSSGDGGWTHLGPLVAEFLEGRGYFVVGFDVRAYLASFTSTVGTLSESDVQGDYRVLAGFASAGGGQRPLLVGVSEGAGLSVLAAADPQTRSAIAGVIGLGLPDINELGWRWRDAMIYLTHGVPNEPTFSTTALIGRASPAPVAAIHSTHDEFVPLAEVQRVLAAALEPHRLWVVDAANHRFSDNQPGLQRSLLEAIAWVQAHAER